MVDVGFVKAQTDNLPYLDAIMVADFFSKNPCFSSSEIRGVKAASSSREQYGDAAIGYVQLKRDTNECVVKAKICPEHRFRNKEYNVTAIINEKEGFVQNVECHDCAASTGGCKHAVALLMWLHRKSEEPSCTSVKSYWKKSTLSKVGSSLKYIRAKEIGPLKGPSISGPSAFFNKFILEANEKELSSQLMKQFEGADYDRGIGLSLHHLILDFVSSGGSSCDDFLKYCNNTPSLSGDMLSEVEHLTRLQSKSNLLYELRYGRITASKAYEVSRCTTPDGCLVEIILGAHKSPSTNALKRGQLLEPQVREELKSQLGAAISMSGLILSKKYPFIGASPDGIGEDFVVEIKCPTSTKTLRTYIHNDTIGKRFETQMQLQMYLTKNRKAIFCVADPQFVDMHSLSFSRRLNPITYM